MKSFIAFSMLVASSVAQVTTFVQPDFFGPSYAPGYAYSAFGTPYLAANPAAATPASTIKTERVAPVAVAAPAYAAYAAPNYFYNSYNPFSFYGGVYGSYSAFPAVAAAAPTPVAAVEAAPAAAPAVDDVEVVEADSAPLVSEGPVTIRAIFPIFGSGDLRTGGTEEIVFARPDQVAAVEAVKESDDAFVTIANPDLAAPFTGFVQASQPTFFYNAAPFQAARVFAA